MKTFIIRSRVFITYEELKNGTTGVSIGESFSWSPSGRSQALQQGRVTTDMKWIDIKIKDLKKRINEQSVLDASQGLFKNS